MKNVKLLLPHLFSQDRNYSREIPIEPTYCGIKLNTITSDRVEVNLIEQGFREDSITIKSSGNE